MRCVTCLNWNRLLPPVGLVRLAATKAAGYQEHASEYGEHWNFFLTLAAVALLTSLIPIPSRARIPLGAALLIAHQTALSWGGLSAVVHSEGRGPSLLSRNKEGLLSIPGYWALHLLSAGVGELIQSSAAMAASAAFMPSGGGEGRCQISLRPLYSWAFQWGFAAVALNALTTAVAGTVESVSRRACNAAYVCWMLGFNVQVCAHRRTLPAISPPSRWSFVLNGAVAADTTVHTTRGFGLDLQGGVVSRYL